MDGYHHVRPCFGRLFRARKQVRTGQGNFPSRWRIPIKTISNQNILHCVSPRSASIKRKVYAISADAQMNSNGPPFQHPQNLREFFFCINYYESNSSPLLYATENGRGEGEQGGRARANWVIEIKHPNMPGVFCRPGMTN